MATRLRRSHAAVCGVLLIVALQLIVVEGVVCQSAEDPSPNSAAEFIPEVKSMRPGESFTVALRITLDPGWHSYWQNPGDAGQPAAIDWEIPAGFRAGEIQWPYPRTVEESTVTSYGYEDEVVLLAEILPPRFMTTGHAVTFTAEARWLVCNNICLPASAALEFELRLTDEPPLQDARWESLFAQTRSRLPRQADGWEMNVCSNDDSLVLTIIPTETPDRSFEGAHFFASERGVIDHGAPQAISQDHGVVRIVLRKDRFLRTSLGRLTGVLVRPSLGEFESIDERALIVDAAVSPSSCNH
jgi:DsbC/DsbD-like thiol-disulfide interchange protein